MTSCKCQVEGASHPQLDFTWHVLCHVLCVFDAPLACQLLARHLPSRHQPNRSGLATPSRSRQTTLDHGDHGCDEGKCLPSGHVSSEIAYITPLHTQSAFSPRRCRQVVDAGPSALSICFCGRAARQSPLNRGLSQPVGLTRLTSRPPSRWDVPPKQARLGRLS